MTSSARRTYTMLRLWTPIMDSIRRFGLHPPQEETRADDQAMVDIDLLERRTGGLDGKPGRRSAVVPD